MAVRYLVISLALIVLATFISFLLALEIFPEEVHNEIAIGACGDITREGIYNGIWLIYFGKSKRVASTYGSYISRMNPK